MKYNIINRIPIIMEEDKGLTNFIWHYKYKDGRISYSRWYFDGKLYYCFGIKIIIKRWDIINIENIQYQGLIISELEGLEIGLG